MTTFILHGGDTGAVSKRNLEFYRELAKRIPNNGKILFIFFAQEQDKWEQFLDYNKISFGKTGIEKNFVFEIATPEKSKLIEQINSSNCVYICGGDEGKLREPLSRIKNLSELLKDKVIMGCSAGAYILSTYFYTNSKERVEKGLGILPIKVFCHYDESKKNKLTQLKEHGEVLPTYAIPEKDFVIVEKE